MSGNKETPLEKFSTWQQVVIGAVGLVVTIVSITGGYLVTRAVTEFRLTTIEKTQEANRAKIESQEMYGHPDHERRISKLEVRVDLADRSIDDINRKLDVATAILQRIEIKVNGLEQANRIGQTHN